MRTFPFAIATPAGELLAAPVEQVIVRTRDGAMGILAGHEPILAVVASGPVRIFHDDKWCYYAVSSGVLTVEREGAALLAAQAEPVPDEAAAYRLAETWRAD